MLFNKYHKQIPCSLYFVFITIFKIIKILMYLIVYYLRWTLLKRSVFTHFQTLFFTVFVFVSVRCGQFEDERRLSVTSWGVAGSRDLDLWLGSLCDQFEQCSPLCTCVHPNWQQILWTLCHANRFRNHQGFIEDAVVIVTSFPLLTLHGVGAIPIKTHCRHALGGGSIPASDLL